MEKIVHTTNGRDGVDKLAVRFEVCVRIMWGGESVGCGSVTMLPSSNVSPANYQSSVKYSDWTV